MSPALNDLKHAARGLMRRPAFSLAAVLTLGLGIGANTAIFTLIDSVLLSPLPYESPDRLVKLLRTHPTAPYTYFSYPDLRDLRERNSVFSEVAGTAFGRWPLTGHGDPALLPTLRVTEGFFDVLEVGAERGRLFRKEDFAAGAEKVVVIAHSTWQGRFGGDPDIVGRTVNLQDDRYTIVGVLPRDAIQYPQPDIEVWTPARLGENDGRGSRWLSALARLRPEVTMEAARSEALVIADQLAEAYPEVNDERTITLEPLREHMVADVRTLFLVLLAAVGTLLVIACANVANLLLSRITGRTREIAVRMAMGAARRHVMGHLLAESLVLALLGGIAGVVFAFWTVDAFLALSPVRLPRQAEVGVDVTVLGFSLALALLTGLAAGLLPALQASRPDLTAALKEGDARSGASRGRRRVRSVLAVTQIALSVVLLVAAGLLVKSFARLMDVDPGFRPERVVSASLALPSSGYPDGESWLRIYDRLTERISSLPGVGEVATASMLPLTGQNWCSGFILEGQEDEAEECAEFRSVSPSYFQVMGIRSLAGRGFTAADDASAPLVAIIDRTMADRFWPGQEAIGHQVTIFDQLRTIVGVVSPVHAFGLNREPKPTLYLPQEQHPLPFVSLVARTAADPASIIPAVRREVWSLDPDLPIYDLSTGEQLVSRSVASPRFRMIVLAAFAALALLLAAVGIYGVIAYDVSQRTREIGVRVALGARAADVLRQVLGEGARLILLGLGCGLLVALAATRVVAGFLFGVEPIDMTVYLGVALFLTAVAALATWVPARRATRVDPITALRQE